MCVRVAADVNLGGDAGGDEEERCRELKRESRRGWVRAKHWWCIDEENGGRVPQARRKEGRGMRWRWTSFGQRERDAGFFERERDEADLVQATRPLALDMVQSRSLAFISRTSKSQPTTTTSSLDFVPDFQAFWSGHERATARTVSRTCCAVSSSSCCELSGSPLLALSMFSASLAICVSTNHSANERGNERDEGRTGSVHLRRMVVCLSSGEGAADWPSLSSLWQNDMPALTAPQPV